jgi:hypothetical protein
VRASLLSTPDSTGFHRTLVGLMRSSFSLQIGRLWRQARDRGIPLTMIRISVAVLTKALQIVGPSPFEDVASPERLRPKDARR